ncbi:hypothetical protein ACFQS4_10780 [Saliphagus sp. GCM10025317]
MSSPDKRFITSLDDERLMSEKSLFGLFLGVVVVLLFVTGIVLITF